MTFTQAALDYQKIQGNLAHATYIFKGYLETWYANIRAGNPEGNLEPNHLLEAWNITRHAVPYPEDTYATYALLHYALPYTRDALESGLSHKLALGLGLAQQPPGSVPGFTPDEQKNIKNSLDSLGLSLDFNAQGLPYHPGHQLPKPWRPGPFDQA